MPRPRTLPRIGVDLSVLRAPYPASLARCVRSAVAALRARDDVDVVPLGPQGGSPRAWRLWRAARAARRSGVDGVHSFVSGFPPTAPGALVQTVHELPWRHGEAENAGATHRLWLRLGAWRARRVAVPSEHVAHDLAAELGPDHDGRVAVIPWGVDPRFADAGDAPAASVELGGVRIDRATLLAPLGGRPKKRADRAAAALEHLPLDVRLVVTGPTGPGLDAARAAARAAGAEDRVEHLPWIDEAELPRAVAAAGAVLVLARSEGFAHPALEALATGRPCVAAPGGAAAELLDGCGELADPDDARALAAAIERALGGDRARADAGRLRAAQYTWERWAERTAALWHDALGEAAR